MRQYYYTVASLPAIRFEEMPFLSQEEFLEYCAIEATPEDLETIRSAAIWLTDDDETEFFSPSPVHREWIAGLRELQRQAALIRAQALGRDTDRLLRPDITDAGLTERLRIVMNEDTPLKTENALLRLLWQRAENLEAGHHFDREKLLVYHLKLQIAARRARINDTEAGAEAFDQQYEVVAQSLMEIAT
ncbi:MAG: hypothetical protein ACOCYQ_01265 [Alkalispirochaeta sp.]